MIPSAPITVWLSAAALVAALRMTFFALGGARQSLSARQLLSRSGGKSMRDFSHDGTAGAERLADGFIGRLRDTGRRLTPVGVAAEADRRIGRAGMTDTWGADRWIAMKGLVSLSVFFTLFILAVARADAFLVMLAASLATLSFFLPDLVLVRRGSQREDEIQRQLGDILDQVLIAVEAGASLDSALDRISRASEGPLQSEFRRVLQDIAFGMSRKAALQSMVERTTLSELRTLLTAISQSEEHGLAIGNILRVQASEIRDKRHRRAEEAAMKVPVKIVFPLILCILPCLMAIVIGPAVVQITRNLNF